MMEAAETLANMLRTQPRLPFSPADPSENFMDVNTGNAIPYTCGFRECMWVGAMPHVTRSLRESCHEKAAECYEHPWDFELRAHVLEEHGDCFERLWRRHELAAGEENGRKWDIYKEAMAVCARRNDPIAGLSLDRRALAYTLQLYNDEFVRSLVCGIVPFVLKCWKIDNV